MKNPVVYEVNAKPEGGWTVSVPFDARLHDYISERIAALQDAGDSAPQMENGVLTILHFVPREAASLNFSATRNLNQYLAPVGSSATNFRFNADGYLTYSRGRSDATLDAYAQLYRDGTIESVTSKFGGLYSDRNVIASLQFERDVLATVASYVLLADELSVAPPWSVVLTMVRARGYAMASNRSQFWFGENTAIDRDVLRAEPVIVQGSKVDLASILQPVFDFFWQSSGLPGSENYDAEGKRLR